MTGTLTTPILWEKTDNAGKYCRLLPMFDFHHTKGSVQQSRDKVFEQKQNLSHLPLSAFVPHPSLLHMCMYHCLVGDTRWKRMSASKTMGAEREWWLPAVRQVATPWLSRPPLSGLVCAIPCLRDSLFSPVTLWPLSSLMPLSLHRSPRV